MINAKRKLSDFQAPATVVHGVSGEVSGAGLIGVNGERAGPVWEVDGGNERLVLSAEAIWDLFGEKVGNEEIPEEGLTVDGDGIQFQEGGSGGVMDRKGGPGGVATGNGGSSVAGGGGDENLGKRVKLGRPKGSKNKKKSFGEKKVKEQVSEVMGVNAGEFASTNGAINGVVVAKRIRIGRPKGSKNRKRIVEAEELQGQLDEGGGENGYGKKGIEMKVVRFGRPKGSKNKKKIDAAEEIQGQLGEVAGYGGKAIEAKKGRIGRPKGSKKGKKIEGQLGEVSGENGHGDKAIEMKKGLRGRPKGSKKMKKIDAAEEIQDRLVEFDKGGVKAEEIDVGNEAIEGKKKKAWIGEPKGSKNKKKIVAAEEIQDPFIEFTEGSVVKDDGIEKKKIFAAEEFEVQLVGFAEESVVRDEAIEGKKRAWIDRPKGSKKKRKIVAAEEIQDRFVEFFEGSVLNDKAIEGKKKERRGRPKGSKNKKKILAAAEIQDGLIEFAEGSVVKDKAIEGKKILAAEEFEGQMVGLAERSVVKDETIERKKKAGIGKPKGSKNKKKILAAEAKKDQRVEFVEGSVVKDEGIQWKKKRRGRPKGSKNKEKISVPQGSEIVANELALQNHGEYENVSRKRKLGRPKKKPRIIIAGEILNCFNKENTGLETNDGAGELLLAESSNFQKKRRGRPRKYVNVHNESASMGEKIFFEQERANRLANSGLAVSSSKFIHL